MSQNVKTMMKALVAASAAFRTAVGAADAPAALASIYIDVAPFELLPFNPTTKRLDHMFCVVSDVDKPESFRTIAGGGADVRLPRGELQVEFVGPRQADDRAGGEDEVLDIHEFNTLTQTIRDEILALAGTDAHLILKDLSKRDGPYREPTDSQELGPCYLIDFTADWGW